MIDIETITCREILPQAKERWEGLAQRCGNTVPYLTYEWYHTALETVDRDKDPLLIFIRQNGEDVGLAPFVHSRPQGPFHFLHKVGFIDNPFSPYQGILHTIDYKTTITSLMQFMRKEFGHRFFADLDEMRLAPHEMEVLDILSFQDGLFLYRKEEKPGSRYLILRESFEENFKSLSKHTQKEFKRKINRISRIGKVGLRKVAGREQIDRHLENFFAMYARTWKGAEPHPEFYYRMCHEFEKKGQLYFHALTLNEKPVAYLISVVSGDTFYGIKTTYNPSFYAYSPGVLLFYKVIEDMFNTKGIREFDIGRGDEQFKREWTPLAHKQMRLFLYPSSLLWRASTAVQYDYLPKWKNNELFNACYSFFRRILSGAKKSINEAAPQERPSPQALKRYEYEQYRRDGYPVTARFAHPGDLDLITVATEARSFAEVQERLANELCVLCFDGEKLLSFFWLQYDASRNNGNSLTTYSISEWGECSDTPARHPKEVFISSLLALLKETINKPNCAVFLDSEGYRTFDLT